MAFNSSKITAITAALQRLRATQAHRAYKAHRATQAQQAPSTLLLTNHGQAASGRRSLLKSRMARLICQQLTTFCMTPLHPRTS